MTGTTNAWFETGHWKLAAVRPFEPDEQGAGATVCIIGETARREIFGGSPAGTTTGTGRCWAAQWASSLPPARPGWAPA